MPVEHLSDFDEHPWCQEILSSKSIEILSYPGRRPSNSEMRKIVPNSMLSRTLWTDHAIRAFLMFKRRTTEGAVTHPDEYCLLLSLGDGLDGMIGRAHGGFNALVIDQITGVWAHCRLEVMSADNP